jgi:hypothetical protein
MINWYQLSPKSARNLILIIVMSSHPIKITAGGIVDLSFSTLGNVRRYTATLVYVLVIFMCDFSDKIKVTTTDREMKLSI